MTEYSRRRLVYFSWLCVKYDLKPAAVQHRHTALLNCNMTFRHRGSSFPIFSLYATLDNANYWLYLHIQQISNQTPRMKANMEIILNMKKTKVKIFTLTCFKLVSSYNNKFKKNLSFVLFMFLKNEVCLTISLTDNLLKFVFKAKTHLSCVFCLKSCISKHFLIPSCGYFPSLSRQSLLCTSVLLLCTPAFLLGILANQPICCYCYPICACMD